MVLGDDNASHTVNRVFRMLAYFQSFGKIYKNPSSIVQKSFSEENKSLYESVLEDYRKVATESSVSKYHLFLLRFDKFLKERGIVYFMQLELHHINIYIESFESASLNTIRARAGELKRLFEHAYNNGYSNINFSNVLPKASYSMHRRLPETFTSEEIERILESINRNNPVGKRNYAILLLIARLGLRISDVLGLRFDSINWQAKNIFIKQQKTKASLELPLPEDAGWAVIDYLKNGRPETTCEYIFVRHLAPYDKMTGDFTKIISDAIKKSGVKPTLGRTLGTHTPRHSIATTMLDIGITVSEISQMLGHT